MKKCTTTVKTHEDREGNGIYGTCRREMTEVGVIKMEDFSSVTLYQCESCKTVKII